MYIYKSISTEGRPELGLKGSKCFPFKEEQYLNPLCIIILSRLRSSNQLSLEHLCSFIYFSSNSI